jgi:acyl carrier protein
MTGRPGYFLVKIIQAHLQVNPGATMRSNALILNKLLATLHERYAIDIERVTNASRLSDIGVDSLHLVDIMLEMENEFSFRFESLLLPPNPSLEQISLAILTEGRTPD